MEKSQLEILLSTAKTFPRNDFYAAAIARSLLDNDFFDQAKEMSGVSLRSNKLNYVALEVVSLNPLSSNIEKVEAEKLLSFLNPYYTPAFADQK